MEDNIKGFPGYHITRDGKVYSNKLGVWIRKHTFIVNPHNGRNGGYEYVVLKNNGKQKGIAVHKLVALTYIPNPNNYPIVMHKDLRKEGVPVNIGLLKGSIDELFT